ncbi:MAG: ribbon-helix-helix protein, CopG family [Thermoleophilaceae bacterium]
MRTTVTLSDDTAAAVDRMRAERSIGVSEAVNELIRAGLIRPEVEEAFSATTYPMRARLDLSNIADAIEELEGPGWR